MQFLYILLSQRHVRVLVHQAGNVGLRFKDYIDTSKHDCSAVLIYYLVSFRVNPEPLVVFSAKFRVLLTVCLELWLRRRSPRVISALKLICLSIFLMAAQRHMWTALAVV